MERVFTFLEKLGEVGVVRPAVLAVTLWMTYDAYQWAARFAEMADRPGLEVTGIIAAVIAPVSLLQGWIFKLYNDSCHLAKE